MNIGWWLQLIGLMLGFSSSVFLILGFLVVPPKENIFKSLSNLSIIKQVHYGSGDNVAGDKIIQRKLFSDTQYIKFWPSSLGGVDRLNLDNVATLKGSFPYNENFITTILNVVPVEQLPRREEGKFETQDVQFYQYNNSQKYVFDTTDNKSHRIIAEGRIFVITLNKIKKVAIEKVGSAIEYEFGISETE